MKKVQYAQWPHPDWILEKQLHCFGNLSLVRKQINSLLPTIRTKADTSIKNLSKVL